MDRGAFLGQNNISPGSVSAERRPNQIGAGVGVGIGIGIDEMVSVTDRDTRPVTIQALINTLRFLFRIGN